MTCRQALEQLKNMLAPLAGQEAAQQARLIVCHALALPASALLPDVLAREISPAQEQALLRLGARRAAGEPLQYILGEWEFMGLPFYVAPCALIPRQDTETLCEAVLARRAGEGKTLLDLCCGTGCIGVSLAKRGGFSATLADISADCLALAGRNAARNGVDAALVQGDLFQNLPERYDVICCNPPYIPATELAALQREVQREPMLALDGGPDGLAFYRRIAQAYRAHLKPGGLLALEVGIGQADAVSRLLGGAARVRDLCGVERVLLVEA